MSSEPQPTREFRLRVRHDSPLKSDNDKKLLEAADNMAIRLFNNELADLYNADEDIRGFLRAWLAWKDERL